MKHDRQNFSSFWAIFCPFTPDLGELNKMNFSKKPHFLERFSIFKARYKKTIYTVYCKSRYEAL